MDILRGAAILLVIGRHSFISGDQAGRLGPLADGLNRFGWTGVDLFFVLSGFLVGGLLLQELRSRASIDVKRFLVRRAFKIWSSYFVYLVFLMGATWVNFRHSSAHPFQDMLHAVEPNLLHVQNYLWTRRPHTWSLAVEEHFYLALPLFLILATRNLGGPIRRIPALPWAALGLTVACTLGRFWTAAHLVPFSFGPILYRTHLRIDSLFFGVFLAYLYHYKPDFIARVSLHRTPLFLAGLLLVAPMAVLPLETHPVVVTLGLLFLYLGYGAILMAMVLTPLESGAAGRVMRSKLCTMLAFIGFYSYPIYLWHTDAGQAAVVLYHRAFVQHLHPEIRWVLVIGVFALVSVLFGAFMGVLVERPALALRDRLFPGQGSPSRRSAPRKAVPEVSPVEGVPSPAIP